MRASAGAISMAPPSSARAIAAAGGVAMAADGSELASSAFDRSPSFIGDDASQGSMFPWES